MIGFKKLHPDAILPTYATAGAACFDLYAVDNAVVLPGDCVALRTGLAVNLPANLALLIYSRSGHGFKYGVRLVNCVGVIDSDYKGEIMVKLHNDGQHPYAVEKGERIAQGMLVETMQYPLMWVDDVGSSERGEGGFGSTGR